jgi:hypothetical protein
MARSRAIGKASRTRDPGGMVRIGKECLELDAATPHAASLLRGWIGQVNSPAFTQPYLVEGPPGRFRLYVGEAAERERTAHGIL